MLAHLIDTAFHQAFQQSRLMPSTAWRSQQWVESLAHAFRNHYAPLDPDIFVFSRDFNGNYNEFGLKELLFDILVVHTQTLCSNRGKPLKSISAASWLIESNFHLTNSREVLIDLNKLLLGSAENKLLAIAKGSELVEWVQSVIPTLPNIEKTPFFLALIPHPEEWEVKEADLVPEVYALEHHTWQRL